MNKSKFINFILVLFSVVVTLVAAEFIFRSVLFGKNPRFEFLRDPSRYALYYRDGSEDFYNEDYWKLNYLFGRGFEMNDPHPLLGWTGFFDKNTYDHRQSDNTETKRPVLLYGDSFAMCVDSVECFDDILNGDSVFSKEHVLLNYGVGGYGTDQIYLLFHETVQKYKNPYVVFSLLTTDLDRSMLSARDGQKPYFISKNGEMALQGTPITMKSSEYFDENRPEITSYLWNRLVNTSLLSLVKTETGRLQYIEKIKEINTLILNKTFEELKTLHTDYVVLIFQPAWHNPDDWRLLFLREICEKNDVPYICDVDIRKKAMHENSLEAQKLFIPNDGHPTSLANKIVSNEIKTLVMGASGYPLSTSLSEN